MKLFRTCIISAFTLINLSCYAQADYTPKENWCIQKATDQSNNDVLITANLSYKDYAYKASFPWCLAVNIITVNKYPNGHPTPEEAAVLNDTEDIITSALRQAGVIQYVGRVTVKDYRELYYFVADPERADAILSRLTKKRQPRRWEYSMQQDPQWERVAPFFSGTPKCL
ncbi:DUF695 domain-containing protein [Hymenobacter sediminis]|uniref:DUF695 domain-containing protein n=1 Tax=Hymenobacter sediminis TaxID=2218621 RepID=UPI000DA68F8E|nr:DUF695 domain-containing protein [Hymenobacter sediminis]RPD46831.1 DUF695 domain-containing protein [Hymenobacter sediminis]